MSSWPTTLHLVADLEGMGLSVEDKLVGSVSLDLDGSVVDKDEVQVLEGLGEEEALLEVVETATISLGDVAKTRVATTRTALGGDAVESLPGEVLVLLVTGGTVGVVDRLHGLGAQDVVSTIDPETSSGVKVSLISGRLADRVGRVDPTEDLGANAAGGGIVRLEVRLGEGNTELGVLVLLEQKTTKDKVTASKTGD